MTFEPVRFRPDGEDSPQPAMTSPSAPRLDASRRKGCSSFGARRGNAAVLHQGSIRGRSFSANMVGSQWAVYEQTTLPNAYLNLYPVDHATTVSTGDEEFQMPDATSSSPTFVNYFLDTFTISLTRIEQDSRDDKCRPNVWVSGISGRYLRRIQPSPRKGNALKMTPQHALNLQAKCHEQ